MTLVATYKYKDNNSIFMLGDGLLSSSGKPTGNFIMPGTGKVGRPKSKFGYYLHSIEQKLNVLGSDLAFVWADDHSLAKDFGIKLYNLYNEENFDFSSLQKFTSSWTKSLNNDQKKAINICLVYHHEKIYRLWKYNGKNLDGFKHFSSLWISGSGEDIFKNTLFDEKDVVDDDLKAQGHSMNLLNKFYHDDLFVMKNYNSAFGGFYELAACTQSGINKISDVMITTFKIDARDVNKGIGIPMTFIKHDVYNHLSILREIKGNGSESNIDFVNTGHGYLPIVPELRKIALKASDEILNENQFFNSKLIGDLNAKHTIVMLWFEDDEFNLKIPLYWRKKKRNSPVTLSLVNGQLELFMSNEFLEAVNRNIESHVDKENGKLKNL